MLNKEDQILVDEINYLREEKNAVILAHYYQVPEIQDLADFKGDSLALAQKATQIDAELIVFCGVHFMAETAKILNPDKTVVLPDLNAGCSLADSCPAEPFAKFKAQYPNHMVISYINCSADIKTQSDLICTSGNAVQLVESFPKDEKIIFAPDKNLGGYINNLTGRNMVLWDGTCEVHDLLTTEAVFKLSTQHPDAKVVAHPECSGPILKLADYIGSTKGMLNYCRASKDKKFIVASETGILHQMQIESPEKEFLVVPANESCKCNDCPYMKMNTLEKLRDCMRDEQPEILMAADVIEKSRIPIERMLDLSKKLGIIK